MSEIREYKFVIIFMLVIVLIIGGMFGLAIYKDVKLQAKADAEKAALEEKLARYDYLTDDQNPLVTITMENDKKMVFELFPKEAPTTVENFISVINSGFYNGLSIFRIEKEFVMQSGSAEGSVAGTNEYGIQGEFTANGIENSISHVKGVLSMARTSYSYDTACKQFFVTLADATALDGNYAAFGKIVEGMDVLDEIANTEVKSTEPNAEGYGIPVTAPIIKTITVDTKGITYAEPEKIMAATI